MRKKTSKVPLALLALVLAGCGATTPRGPTIALVEDDVDDTALDTELRDAETHLPVVLERRAIPDAAGPSETVEHDFASARTAYDDGDLERCLSTLPDDTAIGAALAAGDRTTASRALFWRMACLRALGRTDEAALAAHEHAVRDLPLPTDLGSANASAETLLRDAHREVSALPRVSVHVSSEPSGAHVVIDGEATTQLTPADVEVAPGSHLLTLSLPTREPVSIEVATSEASAPVTVTLAPLEPDEAARAFHAIVDAGAPFDDDISLALLQSSLRARSLVLVSRDSDRLRAALIGTADEDGASTIVRAERVGEHTSDVEGLLRDVLVRGRLVAPPTPFYELPELWILVASAVAIGVGVTLGLTLQPDVHTRVVTP